MNKIEILLKELCPNGVEWKEVGDVTQIKKGKQLNKSLLTDDGTYPAYNGGQFESGRTDRYNVDENTTIISQGGASAGFVNFITTKFWANAHCYFLLPDKKIINNKYLYHFIKMKQNNLMESQYGSGIPALKVDSISKIKIPIPPLEIQEEIVKILDKFTDYVTELTTELTFRQKQYNHYRDKLLTFENQFYKVEWKTLESISISISTGLTPKKSNHDYYVGGTIPWLRTNEVRNNEITKTDMSVTEKALKGTSIKWISKNSVIVAISGATAGRVAINKIPLTTNQHCCCLTIDSSIANYKYVFYWLLNKNEDILDLKQGARGDLNMGMIKKFNIPIPSLEIQSRIVQVLDNFDTVCNDLNIGLPKEIELRQKQYEFFRDKLLTFAAEGVYTDRTGQDRTGQDRTGQDRTGQDRTGQDRTGQDRTGQDRT